MERHYAIFWTDADHRAMWCRARTKAAAVRKARTVSGIVGCVSYGARYAWDAPTFMVSADVVADYRPVAERRPAGAPLVP